VLYSVASDDFEGEVNSEESQEEFKFGLSFHPEAQVQTLELVLDEFEGQDLNYLLKHFGASFDFAEVTVFAGLIMINQSCQALEDEFEVGDLYSRCQNISFTPKFKEVSFEGGKVYSL